MYQLIIESFIGLKKEGDTLSFQPCIPADWPLINVTYRFQDTTYQIEMVQENNTGVTSLIVDGIQQNGDKLMMVNDSATHQVRVTLAGKQGAESA
jgi:cyclic beta-1,2-glucan synthetase